MYNYACMSVSYFLSQIRIPYFQDDYDKAAKYFERAAGKGDFQAMFQLGVIYYDGLGGLLDQVSNWYKILKHSRSSKIMLFAWNLSIQYLHHCYMSCIMGIFICVTCVSRKGGGLLCCMSQWQLVPRINKEPNYYLQLWDQINATNHWIKLILPALGSCN